MGRKGIILLEGLLNCTQNIGPKLNSNPNCPYICDCWFFRCDAEMLGFCMTNSVSYQFKKILGAPENNS